jgi:hypothetical protein
VLKSQPTEGLALWKEYFQMLWNDAFGAVTTGFDWMARNDIDALEAYSEEFKLPQSVTYDPRDGLSYAAANYCSRGDKISGERLLAILEDDKAYWKPDRDMQAMDWSRLTTGVLHCRGDQAAIAMIDPVLVQMEADIATKQEMPNQQERDFVVGVIRSEVSENLIQPIVLNYIGEGKSAAAKAVFERMPIRATTMAIGDVGKGPLGMEFPAETFEQFVNSRNGDDAYSDDPSTALKWFAENYDPDAIASDLQREKHATNMMKAIWPAPLAREVAKKMLAALEGTARIGRTDDFDQVRLWVATVERHVSGCDLSDESLRQLLGSIPSYEFDSSKVEVLTDYVRYLDTPRNARTDTDCIVR